MKPAKATAACGFLPEHRLKALALIGVLSLLILAVFAPAAFANVDSGNQVSSNPAWEWVNPATGAESVSNVSFVSSSEGWGVGMFQGIRHTADGGRTWTASHFGPPLGSLDVCFVNSTHGWIVGQGSDSFGMDRYTSFIWATTDGGQTWHQQLYLDTEGENQNGGFGSVSFTDGNNGWVAGRASMLYRTSDAGATWTKVQDLPIDEDHRDFVDFVDMQWLNAETGFVLGSHISEQGECVQVVLSTVDGGQTWTSHDLPEYDPKDANAQFRLFFFDDKRGCTAGWGGHVYYTEDGGATWTERRISPDLKVLDCRALFFDDAQHGWIAAAGGKIVKTDDGGLTWQPATTCPASINCLTRLDASTLLATGDLGYASRSADNGATWEQATQGMWSPDSRSLWFTSESNGWMVSDARLLHSKDGGVSWQPTEVNADHTLTAVRFADEEHGWATTANGLILHTDDAGATWQEVSADTVAPLGSLFFVDAEKGWAVGENGAVVCTTDGGHTWTAQESNTNATLNSVYFLDGSTGWAAGTSLEEDEDSTINTGWVLSTTDGGATWTVHKFSNLEQSSVSQVHFKDALHGIALGVAASGVGGLEGLFVTSDGGTTWEYRPMFPFSENAFVCLSFVDAEKGFVMGQNGVIYSTEDGGKSWKTHMRPTPSDCIMSAFFLNETTGYICTSMGAVLKTNVGGALQYQWTYDIAGQALSGTQITVHNKSPWFHTIYLVGYTADGHVVFNSNLGVISGKNLWLSPGETVTGTLRQMFPDCKEELAKLVVYTGEDRALEALVDVSLSRSWTDIDEAILSGYNLSVERLTAISQGYPDGSWKPYTEMTRAQFTKMAVAAFGIAKHSPSVPTFTDVPANDPYYPYVEGAVFAGLIKGSGDGRFQPEAIITREQATAIVARYMAWLQHIDLSNHYSEETVSSILARFSDASAISTALRHELAFAVERGILFGSGGRLDPSTLLVRIQGAAILARVMN